MKLLYKLISGYLILVLLALITDYISVRSYQNIEKKFNQISIRALPHIQSLENVRAATLRIVASTSEFVLLIAERNSTNRKPSTQKHELKEQSQPTDSHLEDALESEEAELIQEGKAFFAESLSRYETLNIRGVQTEQETQLAKKIRTVSQSLLGGSTKLIVFKKNGITGSKVSQAKKEFEESEQLTLAAINEALEHEYLALKNSEADVRAVISKAIWVTTIIDLTAVLLALSVGIFLAQSVSRRIGNLKDATRKISAGNLDEHIATNATDEIGDLARAFNAMTDALKRSGQEVLSAKNFTENIIESMTDLLVVADATATIQRANSAASTILGFDKDEVIGQPLGDLCADHDFLSALELN